MVWIRCHYSDGNSVTTKFNGTKEDAVYYYLGKWFNLGNTEDEMRQCVNVEVIE